MTPAGGSSQSRASSSSRSPKRSLAFPDRPELVDALEALGVSPWELGRLSEADNDLECRPRAKSLLRWADEQQPLIRDDSDANGGTEDGVPFLIFAAKAGCPGTVRLLLQHGASVNATGPKRFPYFRGSALTAGAHAGHAEVIRVLVAGRADLNVRTLSQKTALQLAVEEGHEETLQVLLESEADDTLTVDGKSAALQYLLQHHRLWREACDAGSDGPASELLAAANNGDAEMMRSLIQGYVDLNTRDERGHTALILATKDPDARSKACVRLLLEARAYIHARSASGGTAALWAAKRRKQEELQLLAEAGADLVGKAPDTHRYFPGKNVLQILEAQEGDPHALVPRIDWAAASSSLEIMIEASRGLAPNLLLASLHLSLWDDEGGVRSPGVADNLVNVLVLTLQQCKLREIKAEGKAVQALILSAGILRAVGAERCQAVKGFNRSVLGALKRCCDERQEQLRQTAGLTEAPSVHFEHLDRHGELVEAKPDQRDALPRCAWEWLEVLPRSSFQRIRDAFEAFRFIGAADTTPKFARFLLNHSLTRDRLFYAQAAVHLLLQYARRVDRHFSAFMTGLFGEAFRHAPVKKIARILSKMEADYPQLEDDDAAAADPALRCAYFELVDVVRGSVRVAGDEELAQAVHRLQSGAGDKAEAAGEGGTAGGRFECWRIKNTHHEHVDEDELVGGYRDVKVIGKFTTPQVCDGPPVSMVVEIQVIDAVFLDIKKYMHKPYSIERGDFG